MAAMKGRTLQVWRGASPALVAGVRTKSISINGEPIDITNDDDEAVRKLMDVAGEVSVEISISGVAVGAVLRTEALTVADRVPATEFRYGATEKFAGDFFLASYKETGEYKGAATFEATFQSASTVTYTPAP